jgi:outer membrane lipoprotein-sorting protein
MLKRVNKLILALLVSSVCVGSVFAGSAEEKGLAIAKEMDKRDMGFVDFTASMMMVLIDRNGKRSNRQINTKTLEVPGDGDKSLMTFLKPKDVRGTKMLIYSHKTESDEQWIYLPALKRAKRIGSSSRTGSFMGSEFSYEDMGSQEVERFTYKFLREEKCGKQQCFVNERRPVEAGSGYSKHVMWIDKKHYRPLRVDYYDRKGEKMKTLVLTKYKQYQKKFWRSGVMQMSNVQTGKKTLLKWSKYKFANGLTHGSFKASKLR